jgi:phage terminase small subunit
MAGLTAKQRAFCDEYLIDLNATQAAIRAGYSEKTAYSIGNENLNKPEISDYLVKAKAERSEKTKIDAAWVLNQAVALHNRCMQTEPVIDRNGDHVKDEDGCPLYRFEHAGASKSLELIGKHVGVQAFTDKVVNETTVTVKESLSERLKRGSQR